MCRPEGVNNLTGCAAALSLLTGWSTGLSTPLAAVLLLLWNASIYIDSSALGMLLMLRDRAKKQNMTVTLANAQGRIRQVLDTAQFERLFAVV